MHNTILNYLTYGCSRNFPTVVDIKESDLSFQEAKQELLRITDLVIKDNITDPENTIFQCSGGFDSSVVISYFNNISTYCGGRTTSSDNLYSRRTSEYFKTKHQYVSEEEITKNIDIESCLLEMNKIHSLPRGYTNDLGLYLFVKHIKEKTDSITGGEGIELMYLGYLSMYIKAIYSAIWNKEYSIDRANLYLKEKQIQTNDNNKLCYADLLLMRKRKTNNYFKLMDWWSTGFDSIEIKNIGLPQVELPQLNFFNFVNFVFKWYGQEFYFDRKLEYANHFKLKWIMPYLDKRFIDFSLSLPLEMRNCMGQFKYILYETLSHKLPEFIINRPKEGFVLSFQFYIERKDDIIKLVDKYLKSNTSLIYNYLDYKETDKLIEQSKNRFAFNDLKKLWMLLNLEMWLLHDKTNYF